MTAAPRVLRPGMVDVAGALDPKVWGRTELIVRGTGFSMHRAEIEKGCVCSRHYHQARHNLFLVEKGRLRVTTWQDGLEGRVDLGVGQRASVPPGVEHRFETLEDTTLIEFYWAEADPHDIVRLDQGRGPEAK